MDHNVCAEISTPRCQDPKQSPKDVDHDDVAPALIAEKQPEHQALSHHRYSKVAAQRVDLLQQEPAECQPFADPGRS